MRDKLAHSRSIIVIRKCRDTNMCNLQVGINAIYLPKFLQEGLRGLVIVELSKFEYFH